jgi:hypothetical protein
LELPKGKVYEIICDARLSLTDPLYDERFAVGKTNAAAALRAALTPQELAMRCRLVDIGNVVEWGFSGGAFKENSVSSSYTRQIRENCCGEKREQVKKTIEEKGDIGTFTIPMIVQGMEALYMTKAARTEVFDRLSVKHFNTQSEGITLQLKNADLALTLNSTTVDELFGMYTPSVMELLWTWANQTSVYIHPPLPGGGIENKPLSHFDKTPRSECLELVHLLIVQDATYVEPTETATDIDESMSLINFVKKYSVRTIYQYFTDKQREHRALGGCCQGH